MNEKLLHLILEYKMTKEEAFAFRLAVIYLELSRKYFPDYNHCKLPKRGDPRKCELFRYCWTLRNETIDKLKPDEYRFFIQAQMSIIKSVTNTYYIHPNCLVGEKAWRRWYIWKKYFTQVKKKSDEIMQDKNKEAEIKKSLLETHYALKIRLKELSQEQFIKEIEFILRLYRMNVVSIYFLLLNKGIKEYIEKNNVKIDFSTYQQQITPEIIKFYKELYNS